MDNSETFTPTGARRHGDDFQDVIALELLVDWLEHPQLYDWVEVEADDAGSLDDIKATKGRTVVVRQVKYSVHPDKDDDAWDWKALLSKKTPRSKSLLQKWADSFLNLNSQC